MTLLEGFGAAANIASLDPDLKEQVMQLLAEQQRRNEQQKQDVRDRIKLEFLLLEKSKSLSLAELAQVVNTPVLPVQTLYTSSSPRRRP